MRNRALREMMKSDQQTVTKNSKHSGKKLNSLTARQLYKAQMSVKILRLAAKSISMKLALPKEATASKYSLRQRIRALHKILRNAKNPNKKKLNNRMGSYDNNAINELAPIPRGRIKYCKRQRKYTWLPSHIWNAKRSHMIKRWGYQIPWSSTQKCFRLTHRLGSGTAASDGALCMDTSFYGTMLQIGRAHV